MPKKGAKKVVKKRVARKAAPRKATVAAKVMTAVREWPQLEIFTQGQLAKSRSAVGNQYRKTFASKATDRLCQALATVQSFALEATAPQPRPTILEFSYETVKPADIRRRAVTLAGVTESFPAALLHLARRHLLRDRFAQQVAAITAHLERRSQPVFPAGLEAMASPTTPSSVVETCWLNGTMRTYLDPRSLHDVAEDSPLNRLDLPRPLAA